MSLIAKQNGGADFEPLSAGMHRAVCYGIVDLGTQPSNNPNFKPTRKVAFLWEVPEERIEFEKDGKKVNLPRGISGMWTLSIGAKSKLRPMLESWRGRPFTQEELAGFDLKNVLGANAFLNVVHTAKADKTYANVASVNPLPKGMTKTKPENPMLFFSIDETEGGPIALPANIPDWLKAKIMQSDEYIKSQQEPMGEPSQEEPVGVGADQGEEDVPF